MKFRIKDAKVNMEMEDGQKLIGITLEDDTGYQESFVIDLWEMLDEEHFAEILMNWRDRILKMRKLAKKIPLQQAQLVSELAGVEIDDKDDKESIKAKILDKIAKIKASKET